MLQIDHIYEFLYHNVFKDFEVGHLPNGVVPDGTLDQFDISIFTQTDNPPKKILFYDQEPLVPLLAKPYIDLLASLPSTNTLVTSEHSQLVKDYATMHKFHTLYYFFHGFASLDWYRGYYALNYNKSVVNPLAKDYISYNRIISDDRSYRIYFVSLLKELELLDRGLVSFNVTDDDTTDWRDETSNTNTKLSESAKQHIEHHLTGINKLVIDLPSVHGSTSANILRTINRLDYNNDNLNVDSFWHVVTETVFYYNKLHLTEKIFKPIVSKQPFMLLAAPGNLEYLRSYGFKTFDGIIDETYDTIEDNDQRIQTVINQLSWYCNLSNQEKINVMRAVEPIVLYNFHHFYGNFRHIITTELLNNTKTLFKEIGYDDSTIAYETIYKVLTN